MIGKTVHIGIVRDDGLFQVLATLSNRGDQLPVNEFNAMVDQVRLTLSKSCIEVVTIRTMFTPALMDVSQLTGVFY